MVKYKKIILKNIKTKHKNILIYISTLKVVKKLYNKSLL